MKVALFIPCYIDQFYPQVGIKDIVPTMHQAYDSIAGPSKTADIEQSLVIGAHGARSATIYVVE